MSGQGVYPEISVAVADEELYPASDNLPQLLGNII